MDQAAPIDPSLTPAPQVPESPPPIHRSWGNKRWLTVAVIAGGISILLVVSLVAVLIIGNTSTKAKPRSNNPSASQSATPQATHNPKDDQFFAAKPLTLVYYSFAQTTNSKNVFQSTPDDTENRILDIGFPDKYDFNTSPNGNWLLRWDNLNIQKAHSATPNKFSNLFSLNDKNIQIRQVIWQADSSTVAVLISSGQASNNSSTIQSAIYIIPLLTMQPVTIFQTTANFDYDLVAFPSSTSLYMQENHQGNVRNLSQYNPQTKHITGQYPGLNQNGLLSTLHFSQDMRHGYTYTETDIVQYTIESMEQKVVYHLSRACPNNQDVNSQIKGISVAPSDKLLFAHEALEACKGSSSSKDQQTEPPASRSFILDISQQKAIEQVFNLRFDKIERSLWSPDQSLIWLSIDSQTAYTLRRQPLALQPIPNVQRQALTKERVFPIGWLAPQAK